MKKACTIFLSIFMILTMLFLAGCGKSVVVDGIKLSDTKVSEIDVQDPNTKGKYKTLSFTGVVENTTDKALSFEVVYSFRQGDIFTMRTENEVREITLSPGEIRSLYYTTDKIPGGIIDTKKIFIQNVKEATS